jgi:hypothetical protein
MAGRRKQGSGPPGRAADKKEPAETFTFKATITRTWVMYVIDVPLRVSRALKAEGATPVLLSVNASSQRKTTMTPRKPSGYRVHVHGEIRREAGIREGDTVNVKLARDTNPKGVELPPDLADALREADALHAFRALGPAHQRELVGWMEKSARETTRIKRIARVVEHACQRREKLLDKAR